MRSETNDLVDVLKTNPDIPMFNDSGTKLYMLGPEDQLIVAMIPGKNFHEMTKIELDEFIQNLLK